MESVPFYIAVGGLLVFTGIVIYRMITAKRRNR